MSKTLYQWLAAALLGCLSLQAQALMVLPPECQYDAGSDYCVWDGQPNNPELGALVGSKILDKMVLAHPQHAWALLTSNFVAQWTNAWVNFPVPQAIEERIGALNPNDLNAWLDFLCNGLHSDPVQSPQIDFQQAPQLVVDSFSPADAQAVPLPASAWLFATALLGLFTGSKHRKQ